MRNAGLNLTEDCFKGRIQFDYWFNAEAQSREATNIDSPTLCSAVI
jgi:hypothetical protein